MIFEDILKGKIKGIELLSVDLFDTLVTRSFAYPADLFHAMQRKLVQEQEGEKFAHFAQARLDSEYSLRKAKNFRREITLENIYLSLQAELSLSKEQAEQIRQMELELEERSIFPIEATAAALKKIKETLRLKIILISDTYLPGAFIERILKKHKLTGIFDELYLSSAHGLLKSAGTMFTYVQEEEKIHLKKWYHTGDNMESDYKIPIKAGIRAGLFTGAYLTRYEKNFAPRPGSTHSRTTFAALLRQCRLACPYKSEKEKIIWDTTLNVSAPLLISYVQWCLARAGALGAGRVYFLARDGQILYKLARIMNRFSPTPLELHYLYVSRQALLFPAMEDLDEESLGWILAPTAILTPRIILKRVNIEPEEIESALREHGFKNPDERLSKKNLPAFKSLILDSSVKVLLKKRIAQYREKASGYLQQEGLAKDDRFVLVDIGWNGTLQRSISRLLAKQGKNHPVKGLYFGLHRELKHKPADRLEAFFFSPGKPHGLEQESYIVPIIEMFTAADHGGTVKYEFRDNKYEPVLRNSKNTTGIRWGVKIQQEAMVYLAEAMAAAPAGELRQGIEQNLRLFIKNPTLREAEVYGSYLDAEDQNESYYFPLARKFNLIELFRHYKYGYVHHHNEWREGARKLSSPHMRGGNHKKNAI